MLLPTKAMVDAIWRAGDIKLEPIIMPPTSQMTSVQYYVTHDRLINDQLSGMNLKNKLIVGIKKDIITINRLSSRVAIYGWHHLSGVPIQPYSLVHYREYYDYSHGLRLVSKIAYRNGIAITIR